MIHSITTTSVVLWATLLLPSGVCPSEAFSAASLRGIISPSQRQQQPSSSTARRQSWPLHYALTDSLDNSGERPPKRRGRPPKALSSSSSSSFSASSAAATSDPTPNNESFTGSRTRPRKSAALASSSSFDEGISAATDNNKKSTKRSSAARTANTAASLPSTSMTNRRRTSLGASTKRSNRTIKAASSSFEMAMLDHDLLSKEEEQRLGAQIRRSLQVQQAMSIWVEEKRERIQAEQERIRRLTFDDEDDDDEEEDYLDLSVYDMGKRDDDLAWNSYDIRNPLLFGTASSQAVERLWMSLQDGEDLDDLLFEDGTPVDDGQEAYGISVYDSIFDQHKQRNVMNTPESWMEDILGMDRNFKFPPDQITITDEEVRQVLDLPGGRSQLRTILLDGALAREKLMQSNVKLVMSIAQKWVRDQKPSNKNSLASVYNGGMVTSITGRPTLEEAIQEGVLGLAEAAERFDPDRGFRFSTYATPWVTNRVRLCFQLESTSGIRLPVRLYEIKRSYVKRVRHYINTKQSVPSTAVLANDLGITENRLMLALKKTQPLQSLDAPLRSSESTGAGKAGAVDSLDGTYTVGSLLACDEPMPEDHVERSLLRQCLENAMATELSPNERDVLRLRLGLDDGVDRTVNEVAKDVFGGRLTDSAVRNIEQRAFNKLRSPYAVHTHKLSAYLDFAGIDFSSNF